jgi:ribose transport system substrate-binding protein
LRLGALAGYLLDVPPSRTGLLWSLALSASIALAACGGSSTPGENGAGAPPATGKPRYQIAVIPKGTTHSFWSTIHAGAIKAERELQAQGIDVKVIWKGPLREDDREQQIQVVEGFQSQGISAIVLAPLDAKALVRPVEEASRAGIPVVIFDSALDSKAAISFVATDNVKGGRLAGEHMGKLLKGKGKVLMLRYQEGSASTEAREEGFLAALKDGFPGITVISSDQHAGPTRDTAKRVAENLLNRYPDLQGVYCVNESSAAGMLLALQDLGRAGKVAFLGFDAHPVFVEAMEKGEMAGFILQDPFGMGYQAVKTAVQHLQGTKVPAMIDTGVHVITPENVKTPEMAALLDPPVGKYLN